MTSLWRNPDFIKLWVGQTISEFGSRITRDGLGLIAIITLSATPEQLGIFDAAAALPILLFGILAGVPVDRFRRRPLMILTDITRLCLLLTIPFAALTNTLTLPWLVFVAAAMGILGIMFDAAYRALLPALIHEDQLLEGNSKLATTDALAEIGGPAIAGLLIQTISAPLAIFFDAVSYLFSIVSFWQIRTPEPKPKQGAESENLRQEIAAGVRFVLADALLRPLALASVARRFFGNFYGTLYGLYVLRVLEMTPSVLGLLVGCGGIGALIGASISTRLVQRYGAKQVLLGALCVGAVTNALIPLAQGAWLTIFVMMALAQIIGDAAMVVFSIQEMTLRQTRVPAQVLGRVNASLAFLPELASPLGAITAGFLGGMLGVRETLWIAVLGGFCVMLWQIRALRSVAVLHQK